MKISKKEKIRLGIIFAVVVVILVLIFVVVPRFIVVDDINKFDRLMIGNKVIFGNTLCNNTWRVEWKWGSKVLLVNEKSLQDGFYTEEYVRRPPMYLAPEFVVWDWGLNGYFEYEIANVYLDRLNEKYINCVFSSKEREMMCEPIFIRAKHITWFDLNRENVDDHRSELESRDYEYYPAVWIDTALINSDK